MALVPCLNGCNHGSSCRRFRENAAHEVEVGRRALDHHGQGLLFVDDDSPCYVPIVGPGGLAGIVTQTDLTRFQAEISEELRSEGTRQSTLHRRLRQFASLRMKTEAMADLLGTTSDELTACVTNLTTQVEALLV